MHRFLNRSPLSTSLNSKSFAYCKRTNAAFVPGDNGGVLMGSFRRSRAVPGLIATPGQESCDRDIFVQVPPVKTEQAQLIILELFPSRTQQTWKPSEGYPERTPIRKFHVHPAAIEADADRANQRTRSMPVRSAHDSPRSVLGY